ncbi:hypothetical protein [Desulfurobacterium atlanticum]|uniref:Uncharacterized protein n=1 Tax=Desulfurobacterium atlanticum TaxID=240169 RepID=A0A238XNL5_9BACT|nr:hypothetical protein [Desulfurobacterium atlanticum]SNR60616.1 hypothetical protein SAMN06265340_101141 [Desulfurobacterium atlanticum]
MKIYLGYPESYIGREHFNIKDLFLNEVRVDYKTVPVEVKKKLLGVLSFLKESDYIFMDEIKYDASDILEFALFKFKNESVDTVILPGYTYGKSTFIVRELLKTVFGRNANIYHDFNFFPKDTVVVNIGYRETSISVCGDLLTVINIGEYDFVDNFGNYLFNRLLAEKKISNVELRKSGKRGVYLDKLRGNGARILFGRTDKVDFQEESYKRTISQSELDLALSPLTGRVNFGDIVTEITDISSAVVSALYLFEEKEKVKPQIRKVVLIGRIAHLYKPVFERIFGISPEIINPSDLLEREPVFSKNRVSFERFIKGYKGYDYFEVKEEREICEDKEFREFIVDLRKAFKDRSLKGLYLIELLSEKELGGEDRFKFVNELVNISRLLTFKNRKDLLYMDYIIAALSKVEIPEALFLKVENFIKKIAFRWNIPLKTRMNIVYFCYRYREKLKSKDWFKVLLPLTVTWIRDKKLSEGERLFIRNILSS